MSIWVKKRLESLCQLKGRKGALVLLCLGALSVIGHAPFFIWPVFILCMALFFLHLDHIDNQDRQQGFKAAYAFSFGYFLASLYWVASAFLTRGEGYIFLAPLGMVLLPALLALFWAIAGSLYILVKPYIGSAIKRSLVMTILFFGAEYARGHLFSGFPWNLPGYIWPAGGVMSQSASIFGIYGLSFITLLSASALSMLLMRAAPPTGETSSTIWRDIYLGQVLGLLIFIAGYGTLRLSSAKIDYVKNVKFRIVQTQIDQLSKYDAQNYSSLVDTYLTLSTERPDKDITHIIWPEGAITGLPLEDGSLMEAINSVFKNGPYLIMGVTRREAAATGNSTEQDYNYFNSLIALKSDPAKSEPTALAIYNKSRLVPFGEFFPGRNIITSLDIPALTRATASFNFGEKELSQIAGLPTVSLQICYEAIFPGFTPRPHKAGPQPQWILTVSNDAWFGRTTGPYQHMNQVRYRAIEEGLPIIRSASNGISGIIDPYGRNVITMSPHVQGVIDHGLPQGLPSTLYSRFR